MIFHKGALLFCKNQTTKQKMTWNDMKRGASGESCREIGNTVLSCLSNNTEAIVTSTPQIDSYMTYFTLKP